MYCTGNFVLIGVVGSLASTEGSTGVLSIAKTSFSEIAIENPVERIPGKYLLCKKEENEGYEDVPDLSYPTITAVVKVDIEKVPGAYPHEQEGNEVELVNKEVLDSSCPTPSRRDTVLPLLGDEDRDVFLRKPHNTNEL